MSKPYQAVAPFVFERLNIAIMCQESMNLHWRDEESNQAFMGKVTLQSLVEQDDKDYLQAVTQEGETVLIRLDLIENLPTPVKD